jgi:integrase
VFWCRFRHQKHQYSFSLQTSKLSHAKHEMQRLMAQRIAAIHDGTFNAKFGKQDDDATPVVIESGKVPLSVAWRTYMAAGNRPDSGQSTLRQYRFQFEGFCDWITKHRPEVRHLSDVTRQVADQFASHIKSRCSSNTFNKYVRLFALVWNVLKDDAGLTENPWQRITRLKHRPNSRRNFTDEEIKVVLQKTTGEMLTLCLLSYHTALRLGDACLLEWREVNLVTRRITRIPRKTARTSGKVVIVPIHDELYHHLRGIQAVGKYVCPEMAGKYQADSASVTDLFQRLFKDCGIRLHREGTGKGTGIRAVVEVGFHSFRHTWVTLAGERGTDSATLHAIAGWGSPAMERIYSHVSAEHLEQGIKSGPCVMNDSKPPATECPPIAGEHLEKLTDGQLEQLNEAIREEWKRRKARSHAELTSNGAIPAVA